MISGATSLGELIPKLQSISNKISDTTFLLQTKAISSSVAQQQLNALQKEFDVLQKQADALTGMQDAFDPNAPLSSRGISTPFGEPNTTNITVNMGIVGDPESAKRAIIDLQNEGFYRGTGGANLLQGLKGV